jgi:hypothetical protein
LLIFCSCCVAVLNRLHCLFSCIATHSVIQVRHCLNTTVSYNPTNK